MNEIDASIQKLLIENQKYDATDDNRDMIPMCWPCFPGDTITHNHWYGLAIKGGLMSPQTDYL